MNAKKNDQVEVKRGPMRRLFAFLGSIKQEFKLINWTSRKELRSLTKIVLATTFVVSALVYLVDLGIQKSLTVVHIIVQRVFG